MSNFGIIAQSSSSKNISSAAHGFDKNEAAFVFAKHLKNASCPNSTINYSGDFMRQVSPVGVTITVASSATFHVDTLVVSSSSAYDAGMELSKAALKLTYALEEVGRHREAAREVMRLIEDNLHATNLGIANNILTDADVKKLSSRSLIGLIRSSSRAREALPAWNLAYKKSWNEVKRKQKSPEALFVGLPRPREV
ncbi:hypothetical protein [Paracidovorax anthurii]|uniref:hypothetical protein n=1 Tax=Paracidovorax anthurii TaxID=78229 RepID=UPI0011BD7595|nr:hypothetical protein [Paracidovorax anthurii]